MSKSVDERLVAALAAAQHVTIARSPRNADEIDGFVLATGAKWVLVTPTCDGGYFDGLVAVRLDDITGVDANTTFAGQFARTQPEWPPAAPSRIDLASTKSLIRDLGQRAPMIGIEQERRHKSAMTWIGVVDEIGDGWVWLREVRPDASWHEEPLGYRLQRITKVVILNRYQTALAAMAAPCSSSES